MSKQDTTRPAPEGARPRCSRCKDARWVESDEEQPGLSQDPCPDCTDGYCSGCDEPGNTCRECDEEWCSGCWDSEAHGEYCPGKGASVNALGPAPEGASRLAVHHLGCRFLDGARASCGENVPMDRAALDPARVTCGRCLRILGLREVDHE